MEYQSRGMMVIEPRISTASPAFPSLITTASNAAPPAPLPSSQARTLRTGLTKVRMPRATVGLQPKDPTIADLLKPVGSLARSARDAGLIFICSGPVEIMARTNRFLSRVVQRRRPPSTPCLGPAAQVIDIEYSETRASKHDISNLNK